MHSLSKVTREVSAARGPIQAKCSEIVGMPWKIVYAKFSEEILSNK